MNSVRRPFWAIAGVALLGTAGVAGAVIVASPGGEEEVAPAVQATATASPVVSEGPSASASPAPSPTPKATQGEALTYIDPTYGYSFDYPATWYLSPPKDNGGQLSLYSYNLASVPPEEAGMPVPKDKLKVFFWVAEGVDKPIDQWLAEERAKASAEQNLPPPTVVSQSWAALADKQGLVVVIESDGVKSISYYVGLGNERVFIVNAVPADSEIIPEVDKVLATIRFSP
jgi:hypothetical protein